MEFQFIVSSAERRYDSEYFYFRFLYITPFSFPIMVEILQVFNREHTPHIKQQIVHPFDVCFQSPLHYNRASASNALKEFEICDVFFNNHE